MSVVEVLGRDAERSCVYDTGEPRLDPGPDNRPRDGRHRTGPAAARADQHPHPTAHPVETELAELATTHTTLLRLTGSTGDPAPTDPTLASPAYQQILAVFETTGDGLRAKDICRALGAATTANQTEALRAKLKRLVARGVLVEPEPGLFTLANPTTSRLGLLVCVMMFR